MLQNIRDKTKGVFATLIVGVVAITFAMWGIHYYLEESKSTTVVIKVDGAKLTQDQFDQLMHRNQRLFSLMSPNTTLTDTIQQQVQQAAIKQWIKTTSLTTAAKAEHFIVSPELIQETLMSLNMFQEKGQFSPQLYQQKINYLGYTSEQFQQSLQDELLIDQIRYGLTQSAFVLPNELQTAIATLYQTRTVGYMLIPSKQFNHAVTVAQAEIQQYYTSHQKEFMDPERVKIEYIRINPQDLLDKTPISDEQVKAYYQTHLAEYSTLPQWQIQFVKMANTANGDIKATLNTANTLHTQLVKENSFSGAEKQGLKTNELWVTASSAPAEVLTALKTSRAGDWLNPIVTHDGVLLVKVEKITPMQSKPLAEVKQSIITLLQNQSADKLMSTLTDQLDSLAYEDPTTLQSAAQKLNMPTQVSDWLTQQSAQGSNTLFPGAVIAAAFSNDVLQQGYNSNLLTLNDGSVMVLRIKQHEESKVKPLAEVSDSIKNTLLKQKTQQAANQKGQTIIKALQQGQDPKTLAQKNSLVWQQANQVSRTSAGLNPELLMAIFKANNKMQAQKNISGQALSNGDYVVLQIQSTAPGDAKILKPEEKTQLTHQWVQSLGETDYAFYSQEVQSKAKVTMHLPKDTPQTDEDGE
jgi:peptidyl-prolyl cis-trans isomerase D